MRSQHEKRTYEPGHRFGVWEYVREVDSNSRERRHLLRCCNCGCERERTIGNMRRHSTKCVRCFSMPQGESGFNKLFYDLKQKAKERGGSFNISKDDAKKLTSRPCHYCGAEPSYLSRPSSSGVRRGTWGDYLYNGLDWVNNSSYDYDLHNVVPCCGLGNHAKHTMSVEKFEAWLDRVAKFRFPNSPSS